MLVRIFKPRNEHFFFPAQDEYHEASETTLKTLTWDNRPAGIDAEVRTRK